MKNIPQNVIVDGYKLGHISQYINGTESVSANATPRSDRLANVLREHYDGKMVNFGIEMVTKILFQQWEDTFFSLPKEKVMKKFTRRVKNYLGPDHGDEQIAAMAALHDLQYLPVEVRALPEGCKVNMGIPVFTVRNTVPEFYWVTNYCETFLSCMYWPMANAATVTEQYFKTSKFWAEKCGAPTEWLAIANHCFAGRGHRGQEDSMISAMAHLLFGIGTDTLWAIDGIEEYYNGDSDKECLGVSVNAFEHATATQRIAYYRKNLGYNEFPLQAEVESLRDVYTNLYPTGIVSYVADSEDFFGLMETGLPMVKDEILARQPDSFGLCKAVFRPDSSPKTPLEVICGDPDGASAAERKGALWLLWDTFGGTTNDEGLRILNPKVGLIYGEAITPQMQWNIYETMVSQGWCVSNVLMGTGSWGFLKDASRDSFSIAIKGTHSIVNGEGVSMQKNPKTALGAKKSACGLLRVSREGSEYRLWENQTEEEALTGELAIIARDSKMVRETPWAEIRLRSQRGE
jgi:nicotinamide phosphoribosyltransferase